ncbi:hypothetical protein HME9304_00916 [Flagellimonas maritima]|uniref:Uncharacterized protein n=1 Tax=Flagellimonas maritima TaxID=1383885 RepID=A0A2Z4LRF1_9FLAO|nr:DUF6607 family protein [Allomuricauda aurantiaca]AWX43918.1 hypothetical protein HME9304_00916 [Allomuricauda aurantiaca]
MKRVTLFSILSFAFAFAAMAQNKKEQDRKAIKDMCGCYDITFKYTETFAPEIDYEKKMDYTASALELALPIVDEDNKISIQHLLVVNDTMVIKHWRQDWEYENQEIFHYDKENNWVFNTLPADEVKGQWTQKVYQVDDSPRYSGSATWIHADGKHYWENKSDSPLPRREYTKRSDYNVMLRGNRQEITDYGWVHEQDNDKVLRKDGEEDVLLAQEKGWNIYTKVADEKCQLAMDWWKEHNGFWANVRTSWDKIYDRQGDLTLARKVDEKPLFMHLYPLEKMNADSEKITAVLSKFVIDPKTVKGEAGK